METIEREDDGTWLEVGVTMFRRYKVGADYWIKIEDEEDPELIFERVSDTSYQMYIVDGRVGELRCEGGVWVMYRGPLRQRHIFYAELGYSINCAADEVISRLKKMKV